MVTCKENTELTISKTYMGAKCKKCNNSLRYLKRNRCVTCNKKAYKAWSQNNKSRIREKDQRWYVNNKIRARNTNAAWQSRNADKLNNKARRRYENNKEGILATNIKWRDENRDKIKAYNKNNQRKKQLSRYGLTVEDYDNMASSQGGVCAICKNPPKMKHLTVDHCHETGKVRGLLCGICNRGLGCLKDNVDTLKNAIKYLQVATKENSGNL